MIKVAVAGFAGRMGSAVVDAVQAADDLQLACGIDPACPSADFPVFACVGDALEGCAFDVMVDFTRPSSVRENVSLASKAGVDCVVGTTGLTMDELERLAAEAAEGTCVFFAPNFTTGAVLMMQFAETASAYFPEAEVIEYHHARKLDAPSGTAVRTAQLIARGRDGRACAAPGRETEMPGMEGARGALVDGVPVHAVRSMGYVASQEVVFGSMGQTLTIRHDSWDRTSYMPGVLLGIRRAPRHAGLIVGLESFM
ncbi:4-hydroxy-tetrahydrodipicolinate reductase [Eggerthellaceae bacterium zg-1084]|uniref:4-hydroxy-tetrahydrodipicolinate reductase n=1 Tax=Berryella wangjianweii TaxID=2734634 RepID=A0A6M8J4R5_9ACTN|nr:4-hydroxy-tetrahydrodipicolinate reductase [Berryella wangjianweii]NPD30301.1 4-hydroxy-tetrahydrodipicolinate reductase [Berryella wangjianweii]QKF06986.1 4-hydroxy-tetrahydrodipicolinate reductase [Berryella wangjianweii]